MGFPVPSASLRRVARIGSGLAAAAALTAASFAPVFAHAEYDASSRPEIVGGVRPPATGPSEFAAKEMIGQPTPAQAVPATTAADGAQSAAAVSAPVPLPTAAFRPIWPLRGQITTYFGEVGPTSPHGHTGIDISAAWGTPVAAAADGVVVSQGDTGDGYGTKIVIDHPGGFETLYGHLSSAGVDAGDQVRQGQMIGREGSTGYSTGPHLHFEVHQGDDLVDPLALLP